MKFKSLQILFLAGANNTISAAWRGDKASLPKCLGTRGGEEGASVP